jgi:hypothetical protein
MRDRNYLPVNACAAAAACLSLFAAIVTAQAPAAERVFSGKLGDKYRIQMQLRREGSKLSGTYFYERVRQNIALRGEMDALGNFTLREYDAGGAQTGIFKGKWQQPTDCDGCQDYLSGNWSRPDGSRVMTFDLSPYAVAFRGPLKLMTRALEEKNRKGQPEHEITIEYPQLEGAGGANVLRFNDLIRAKAMKALAGYRKDSLDGGDYDLSYEVALANDDLVSVNLISYSHYEGAGSKTIVSETINYDLHQGRPIKLEEIFLSGSDYEKMLGEYALRDLKKDYQDVTAETEKELALQVENVIGDESKWTITLEGLGLIFDWPSTRPTSVIVPYHAIAKAVRPGGPLAKLAARGLHNQ